MPSFRFALACLALSCATAARSQPAAEGGKPRDLILAVDVSLSMLMPGEERGRRMPANDREGIRWDGVQFAIDIARDDDRVALVLYRAENAVVTRYLDDSGFVRLAHAYPDFGGKTGRQLLTELVAGLQRLEEKWAGEIDKLLKSGAAVGDNHFRDFELPLLVGRAGARFRLAHGTASLLALKTAREKLLPRVRPEASAAAFLFTDGYEVRRDDDGPQYRRQDYAYIAERAGLAGAKLDAWAAPWVAEFRKQGVPLFAFGLGDNCDLELLQSLAGRSGSAAKAGRGAAFNPRTNAAMLDELQQLQWGLRGYWVRRLRPDFSGGGREAFTVPRAGAWDDLGLLLYREPAGSSRALAPVAEHVKPLRVAGRELAGVAPRVSRSHWYYQLTADLLERRGVPADGDLEILVQRPAERHGDYATQAVAALRPRRPLFKYREPGATKYTPRDAIPFRVEFTPPEGAAFRPEDFRVEATVTPALRSAADGARPLAVKLEPDPAGADARAPRSFRGTLVLDGAPDSPGRPHLIGPYHVDVAISGVRGPLAGATHRLPRRTLDVAPYPTLTLPKVIELSNDSPATTRHKLDLTLSQPTAPESVATAVTVAIPDGPLGRGRVVAPDQFRLESAKTAIRGKSGSLLVELPEASWSSLAPGDYRGGTLTVKLPWQKKPETVELVLRRRPYEVTAKPDVFRIDLAARGKGAVTRAVEAELKTALAAEEKLWLSATPREVWKLDPAERKEPEPERVEFEQTEDDRGAAVKSGKKVAFRVGGLGESSAKTARAAKDAGRAALPFTLAPEGALPGGAFRRTLYLVGPGVAPTPVTVRVVVNPVSVAGRGGKPLDELYLLGLAGAPVRHTLTFASPRPGAVVKSVSVPGRQPPLGNVSLGGWDRLPLRAEPAGADRIALALEVPWCVQQGKYRTDMTFQVVYADGAEDRSLRVSLPVYLEVLHRGVRFRQGGKALTAPLRLRFPKDDPCADFASAEVQLHTDANEVAVRWSANRVKSEKGAGEAAEDRLDLLFGGASVLARGGPSDPLRRDRPAAVTVSMSRKGLAPGLYRGALRFDSYEDTGEAKPAGRELLADTLQVEMLVPGRKVEARGPEKAPFRGVEATIRVRVACHDCEPSAGELVPLDGAGKPSGPAVKIAGPPSRADADAQVTGIRHYEYVVPVTPPRVGKNAYEIRWPQLCPKDAPPLIARVEVDAQGVIEASQRLAHVNEEVTLRATLHPGRRPEAGAAVVLHVADAADRDKDPVAVELFDDGKAENGDERAGDGVYSARYRFADAGTFTVLCPPDSAVGPLKPDQVIVGFELKHAEQLGTLDTGAPDVLGGFLGKDELTDPKMLHLVNRRSETLRWRARLRYPRTPADPKQLAQRDAIPTATEADPRQHLDARLTAPGAKAEGGWPLSGTLAHDQALDLGIEVRLPPGALEGDEPHPALDRTSAMLLEVDLEWVDAQGQVVARRNVRLPLAVTARDWKANPKVWILSGAALLVAGFVVYRAGRWVSSRSKRRPAAPAPKAPAKPAPEPVPTPRLFVPRSSAGGDVPEHMR